MSDELHKGLDGVLVAESALSRIDGDVGRLVYRGYDIEDLAREASYEEVLYLLWYGHLPDRDELASFEASMADERGVDDFLLDVVAGLAERDEEPMAALRTGVSALSASDPEPDADHEDREATLRTGRRIAAAAPTVLAAYHRLRGGEEPVAPRDDLGHAANFLYMLTGEEPSDLEAETFDTALTLHADHGLNASTFAAMVVASTYADAYNAVTAGVAALSGPWHGGANQDVMEALLDIDERDVDPVEWAADRIDAGERIPGFGHRVYDVKDPRASILQRKAGELAETTGQDKWYEYTAAIEEFAEDRSLVEKGIAPNVDFFSGTVYYQLGIPVDLYTPIFALSRIGGWIGHVVEYQADNRIIRPRARYVGPEEQSFVPLDER